MPSEPDEAGQQRCPDRSGVLAYRACGSGGDWVCVEKAPPPPVCCRRQFDWEYECSAAFCVGDDGGNGTNEGSSPPPPPPRRPAAPRDISGGPCPDRCLEREADGTYVQRCCEVSGELNLSRPLGRRAVPEPDGPVPDNADPSGAGGCDLPYDDRGFGAPHPEVGDQAGPDFSCTRDATSGLVRCQLVAELQTTIASAVKVFAADRVAAMRAYIPEPGGVPAPGKSPDQVLTNPLPCGGVGASPETVVGAGIDVAQAAQVRIHGCQPLTGGALPVTIGVRYESGAWIEQEGLGCAGAQVRPSGLRDRSGYRSANLGNGWTASYSRRLVGEGERLVLYSEDHRVYRFELVPRTLWPADDRDHDGLWVQVGIDGVRLSSRDAATIRRFGGVYELRYTDGSYDRFSRATGALSEHGDRWGNRLVISHFMRRVEDRSLLVKRITQLVPDAQRGYRPAGHADLISEWVWSRWPGAFNVAERSFRLSSVVDGRGEKRLGLEYDGALQVTRVLDWLTTETASVDAFAYDEFGALSEARNVFDDVIATSYASAPPARFVQDRPVNPVTGRVSLPGYRRVIAQRAAPVPFDGVASLEFDYRLDGGTSLQVRGTGGIVQHFSQRLQRLLGTDGPVDNFPASFLAQDGLSTRRDLQVERAWAVGVPPGGPFASVRRDLGTGLVAERCADGADPSRDSCVRYHYRTLQGVGNVLDDHVLPTMACQNDADSSSCRVFWYESEAARRCKVPDRVTDERLSAPGTERERGRVVLDPETCAPVTVEVAGHGTRATVSARYTYSREGDDAGFLTAIRYEPSTRAPVLYAYRGGRLVEVQSGDEVVLRQELDPSGWPVRVWDAYGVRTTLEYGTRLDGQPVRTTVGDAGRSVRREFQYDPMGTLVQSSTRMSDGGDLDEFAEHRVLYSLGSGVAYLARLEQGRGVNVHRHVREESRSVGADRVETRVSLNDRPFRRTILRNEGRPRVEEYLPGVNTPWVEEFDTKGLPVRTVPISGGQREHSHSYMRPTTTTAFKDGQPALRFGVREYYGYSTLARFEEAPASCVETTAFTPGGLPTRRDIRAACPDGPVMRREEMRYDDWGRLIERTATDVASGQVAVATQRWDEQGRVVESCAYPDGRSEAGRCVQQRYLPGGLVAETRQPGGEVTRIEYDEIGLPQRVTDAAGNIASLRYRPDGLLVEQRLDGQIISYAYDAFGRKTYESGAHAGAGGMVALKRWDYDADGNVTRFRDFDGRTQEFEYDRMTGFLTRELLGPTRCRGGSGVYLVGALDDCPMGDVESPSAGVRLYTHHPDGKVRSVELRVRDVCASAEECPAGPCRIGTGGRLGLCEPRTTMTFTEFDDLGNLSERRTGALGLAYRREVRDNRVRGLDMTHELPGRARTVVSYGYDELGRVNQIDAFGQRLTYGYDDRFGLVNHRTGPVVETRTQYDGAGMWQRIDHRLRPTFGGAPLLALEVPRGGRDLNGNILRIEETWRAEPTLVHGFAYDSLGRLTRMTHPALPVDPAVDLCPMPGEMGMRVLPPEDPDRGWGHRLVPALDVGIEYDARGNALQGPAGALTYGIDDRIVTEGYRYDPNGSLIAAPSRVTEEEMGEPICPDPEVDPGATTGDAQVADPVGESQPREEEAPRTEPTRQPQPPAPVVINCALQGGPGASGKGGAAPLLLVMTGLLVSVTRRRRGRQGRRPAETRRAGARLLRWRRALGAKLLALLLVVQLGPAARADTFVYDSLRRLVRAERGDTRESYRYDGRGQLMRRCVARGAAAPECADLLVDDSSMISNLVGESHPEGAAVYVHGPAGVEVVDAPDGLRFPLTQWNQSVVAEVDGEGRLAGRRAFGARGEVRRQVGQFVGPFGYDGELQSDLGLVYLRTRTYDPALGRFLQRDTFPGYPGRPSSYNRFVFVSGNPIHQTDPLGEWDPFTATVAVVGLVLLIGGAALRMAALLKECPEDNQLSVTGSKAESETWNRCSREREGIGAAGSSAQQFAQMAAGYASAQSARSPGKTVIPAAKPRQVIERVLTHEQHARVGGWGLNSRTFDGYRAVAKATGTSIVVSAAAPGSADAMEQLGLPAKPGDFSADESDSRFGPVRVGVVKPGSNPDLAPWWHDLPANKRMQVISDADIVAYIGPDGSLITDSATQMRIAASLEKAWGFKNKWIMHGPTIDGMVNGNPSMLKNATKYLDELLLVVGPKGCTTTTMRELIRQHYPDYKFPDAR